VFARAKLAESFPAEVARSATQVTAPLRARLEQAKREGEMPALEPARDAEMLYLLMMGWLEARLLDGRVPEDVEVERLEAFILAGLSRGIES
jgi:hypothetical protein